MKPKIKSFFKKIVGCVSKAVFPPDVTCDVCGAELIAESRYRLCSDCFEKIEFIGSARCAQCGVPIKNEATYCIRCMNTHFDFEQNRSPLAYGEVARGQVLKLKYNNARYLVDSMSAMMADEFLKSGYVCDCLTYVPMTAKEKKSRGYNQAELLAKAVGERLGIPVLPLLEKRKETGFQKQLTVDERAKNMEGAFVCYDKLKGKRIVVVDDVFTTGTTANQCAIALKKARAAEIRILTLCVTVPELYGDKNADTTDSKKQHKNHKSTENNQIDK